jgi:hypothetical protein
MSRGMKVLIRDDQEKPAAECATADTLFAEGERLRFSVEAPRIGDRYLYEIDREVYSDGSTHRYLHKFGFCESHHTAGGGIQGIFSALVGWN